ncbi:TPA: hypothetical protein EYP38_04850, partial [Candidatus Micrarchaeota archaeon]|nr:hypothetical protein [Candidatus Micrarchaeota archaeon]
MNDLENTIKRLQEGDLAGAENDALEYLTGKTADGSDSAKRDISNEERGRLTAALERALSGQPTSKSAEEVVEGLNAGGLKALDTALRLTDVERVVSREEVGKARTKAILNFSDNDDPAPRKRELLNEMNAAGNALLDEREDARRRAHVIRYMQAEAQMARVDSDVHEAYHQLSNMLGYPTGNPQLDSQTFVPVIGVGATLSDIRESRSDLNMTMEEKAGYVNLARKTLLYMVKRSTDGSGDNNTLKYVCEALALFDGKEIEKALEWVAGNPLRGDEVVEAATNALQTVKERAREKAKPHRISRAAIMMHTP